MQGLLLLVCIIILIVVLVIKSDLSANLKALREKLNFLDEEIQRLKFQKPEEKPSIKVEPTIITTQPKVVEPVKEPPVTPKPILEQEPFQPLKKPPVIEKKPEPVFESERMVIEEPIVTPPAPPKPGFFERNPDLEKFIGENLANKIGIGILVIGIGFFVKYAIDQNWIHEIGRVMIGVLCGGGLLAIGHRMRNSFRPFSSVLVGGGIAVLYTTITIAFQLYDMFRPSYIAFGIMVVITGFTILLSLSYDRIELAVFAILGGFGSPFMVSTGEGNYIALFTYILILNIGMLILAYHKKWNLVNIICYAFTVILFASWLMAKFDGENLKMLNWGMFFSTALYLVFFGMNIINNLKERRPFKAIDFSILLSNTFLYYSAGMYMLSYDYGYIYRGLFTISLAVFNFIFAFSLYKNQKVDRNLVFLLIGLVLTFLSLAAPVQLEGNYITMFWAAEGVLLLWLSQKSGIQLMRLASVLVNVLMVISLVMDWYNMYLLDPTNFNIILNKAYITGLISFASLLITTYLLRSETEERLPLLTAYKALILIAAIGICYGFNLLELQYQMRAYEVEDTAFKIVTGTYNMAFILALILVSRFISMHADVRAAFAAWGAIVIFMYLVGYHQPILEARDLYLVSGEMTTGFYFHYLLILFMLTICVSSIAVSRKLTEFNKNSKNIYSWVLVAFFVFIASYELDHLIALMVYQDGDSLNHIINQNHKIGWPILWGLSSFLLIMIGFRQKIRHLRIISLVLFLITLLKLFLVDIKGISEGGKIAAFISLGILLLIISFMYQRLKKLLLTDDTTPHESESKS